MNVDIDQPMDWIDRVNIFLFYSAAISGVIGWVGLVAYFLNLIPGVNCHAM